MKSAHDFANDINANNVECRCFRCGGPAIIKVHPLGFYYGVCYTVTCDRCFQLERMSIAESLIYSLATMAANVMIDREEN